VAKNVLPPCTCVLTGLLWTNYVSGKIKEVCIYLDKRSIKIKSGSDKSGKTLIKARLHSAVHCVLKPEHSDVFELQFNKKVRASLQTQLDNSGRIRDIVVLTIRSYVAQYVLSKDTVNDHVIITQENINTSNTKRR